MKSHVFLDDLRKPWGVRWHLVKTAQECVSILENEDVEHLSLDHDLAAEHYERDHFKNGPDEHDSIPETLDGSGHDVVRFMVRSGRWPTKTLIIHTMNPMGRERMLAMAKHHAPEGLRILWIIPGTADAVERVESET